MRTLEGFPRKRMIATVVGLGVLVTTTGMIALALAGPGRLDEWLAGLEGSRAAVLSGSRGQEAGAVDRKAVHRLRLADRSPSSVVVSGSDGGMRQPYSDLLSALVSEYTLRYPEARVEVSTLSDLTTDAGAPSGGPPGGPAGDAGAVQGREPALFDLIGESFWPVTDLILGGRPPGQASSSGVLPPGLGLSSPGTMPLGLGRHVDSTERADFVPQYLAALTDEKGELWALPRWVRAPMAAINLRKALAAGLDVTSVRAGGWTWDAFLDAVQKLQAVSATRHQPALAADDLQGDVFRLLLANALTPAKPPGSEGGSPGGRAPEGRAPETVSGDEGLVSALRAVTQFVGKLVATGSVFGPAASWKGRSLDLLWQGKAAIVLGVYPWCTRGYSRINLALPLSATPPPGPPGASPAPAQVQAAFVTIPLPHRQGSPEASLAELAPVWAPRGSGIRPSAEHGRLAAKLAVHLSTGPGAAIGSEFGWEPASLSARAARAGSPGRELDALRIDYVDRASANLIDWALRLRSGSAGGRLGSDAAAWAAALRPPWSAGSSWTADALHALRRLWEGRSDGADLVLALGTPVTGTPDKQ